MSDATPRFQFPFILPGQAQKELYHNEALIRLDILTHAAVEQALAAPPASPQDGQCWIVASGASGAWASHEGDLAMASGAGWRFAKPQAGMQIWDKAAALWRHWTGTEWSDGKLVGSALVIDGQQVVASRRPAIANPSGGTIIDQEARAALAGIIATLMSHGLTE